MIIRRSFLTFLDGAAAWPLAARAQQQALPVVGVVNGGSANVFAHLLAAFRKGLGETGYVEGQNVTVEYHYIEGQYERLPALMADLVRRRVALIATPAGGTHFALAAKAMTTTIPIVFGVGEDPVKYGLVVSLARPGGNATGINFFITEMTSKRMGLLHELVPKAMRVALLVNPASAATAETTLREVQDAARTIGLQIQVFNASTADEIDTAFATLSRERADAVFFQPDGFFASRRVQIATLAAHERVPASYFNRDFVEVGGLMSYGTNFADTYRQVGIYTGSILKGAKPADLPVVQSTRFEFVINLRTAKALGALIGVDESDEERQSYVAAFRQALQRLGWTEGRNLRVDWRWAAENVERARAQAIELVALQPDALFGDNTFAVTELRRAAAAALPIVFAGVTDPIRAGFVASLARPAGNITGFADAETSARGKLAELMREIAPNVTRVAILASTVNQSSQAGGTGEIVEAGALQVGLRPIHVAIQGIYEIEDSIAGLAKEPNSGLIIASDPLLTVHRKLIIALAERYKLPAVYGYRFWVTDGGLLSYGVDKHDQYRGAALYIDRILKGAKPADFPVQLPIKYELVINAKTAKTLGLEVPLSILMRIDEVIE